MATPLNRKPITFRLQATLISYLSLLLADDSLELFDEASVAFIKSAFKFNLFKSARAFLSLDLIIGSIRVHSPQVL